MHASLSGAPTGSEGLYSSLNSVFKWKSETKLEFSVEGGQNNINEY